MDAAIEIKQDLGNPFMTNVELHAHLRAAVGTWSTGEVWEVVRGEDSE